MWGLGVGWGGGALVVTYEFVSGRDSAQSAILIKWRIGGGGSVHL